MNCSIPKSPEGQSAVEILCTFQRGPSHLHCLFSSFGRQLRFETKSPKLSKMWLPPLNFTQADQRQLLQDGTCPNFPEHLSCASKRAALTQVFHPKSLFICPVTHATLDHNRHYTPLDITLRLFETLHSAGISHKKRPWAKALRIPTKWGFPCFYFYI